MLTARYFADQDAARVQGVINSASGMPGYLSGEQLAHIEQRETLEMAGEWAGGIVGARGILVMVATPALGLGSNQERSDDYLGE